MKVVADKGTNVEVVAAAIIVHEDVARAGLAAIDERMGDDAPERTRHLYDLVEANPALSDLTPDDVTGIIEAYADEFPGSMLAEKIERLLAAADKGSTPPETTP